MGQLQGRQPGTTISQSFSTLTWNISWWQRWLTAPLSLGIQTILGRWWSSTQPPCTQQPVLSTWYSFVQRWPHWGELIGEYSCCLGGPHYCVRSERLGGNLSGELELPAEIDSHILLLVRRKEPWYFFQPGASSSFTLPDKVDVLFHWW